MCKHHRKGVGMAVGFPLFQLKFYSKYIFSCLIILTQFQLEQKNTWHRRFSKFGIRKQAQADFTSIPHLPPAVV